MLPAMLRQNRFRLSFALAAVATIGVVFAGLVFVLPSNVSAANKADEWCSAQFPLQKASCVGGYNGAYSGKILDEVCPDPGRTTAPKDNYNACSAGFTQGSKQRRDDNVSTPAPRGTALDERAKLACKADYGESGHLAAVCQRAYKRAVSDNPPSDGNKDCERRAEGRQNDEKACKKGFALGKRTIREADPRGSADPAAATEAARQNNDDGENDDCDFKFFNPLTWVICPMVDGINTAVDQLDIAINNLLTVNTARIFDASETDSTGYAYKGAWNSFRYIGIAIIVISALIVIISSAFGFEILDAYTIRKTLPRLLIALLVITLSWEILYFLISLSNDVGNGVRWIIYEPFSEWQDLELGQGSLMLSNLLLGVGLATLGIMGLLSFGLTALLAALIAFLVLMLRELIIIFLVIIAPIGIACMILPNTRKVWEFWQKALISMLVAFPIIAGMIAVGRVFSATIYANGTASGLEEIIAFIAYLLPYFLLPFAFRIAGGMLATLAGFANDRGRGMFDGLRKYRANEQKRNWAAMKAGNRMQGSMLGTRTAARMFNRTTAGLGTGVKGRFGVGRRGTEAVSQVRSNASAELMKDPRMQAIINDDNALRAATYSNAAAARKGVAAHLLRTGMASNSEDADDQARRAVAAVQASVGFGRPQALAAAQAMVDTGTAYHDIQDMSETIARASGGIDSSIANLAGYANSKNKAVGRHDLAPGFGSLMKLSQAEAAVASGSPTMSTDAREAAYAEATEAAWRSGSLYQHANDKPRNIERAIEHFTKEWNSGDFERQKRAAVFFEELKAMQPNTSGEVRNHISNALSQNGEAVSAFLGSYAIDKDNGGPVTKDVYEIERDANNRPVLDNNGQVKYTGEVKKVPMTVRETITANHGIREYRTPNPNEM